MEKLTGSGFGLRGLSPRDVDFLPVTKGRSEVYQSWPESGCGTSGDALLFQLLNAIPHLGVA